jgi:hypothetical protein
MAMTNSFISIDRLEYNVVLDTLNTQHIIKRERERERQEKKGKRKREKKK